MANYVSRQQIIHATMRCARRLGLPAVTINVIGKEVGILGQGLYNHFSSKDELLAACFNYCDRQLSDLYENFEFDPDESPIITVRKLWFKYFEYFINHPDENSFYRQFRETIDFPHQAERDSSYFRSLREILGKLNSKYHMFENFNPDIVLAYIRTVTPVFARFITDEYVPNTPEIQEQMWKIISGGFKELLNQNA